MTTKPKNKAVKKEPLPPPPDCVDNAARAAVVTLAARIYHIIGRDGYEQLAEMLKTPHQRIAKKKAK